MDWNASLQNSYVDNPILNMSVVSDKVFKEFIKVKWGHQSGALIRPTWLVSLGESRMRQQAHIERTGHMSQRRKAAVCKATKRDLRRNQICRHLDLGLPASRIVRKYSSGIFFLISIHMCIYLFTYKYIYKYMYTHNTHTHIYTH